MNPFANRPKTITPERPKAKATGKMYQSLADLAHLINTEDATGWRHEQKGEDHLTAASIQQQEYDERREAMIDAAAELTENFVAGRMESPKMDALPTHDRKQIAGEIIEVLEADLVERKATTLETEALEIVTLLNEGVSRFVEAGRKLIAHKARIDETGEDWGLWVAKAFPAFAPRTLGRYMTLARRAEDGEAVVMLPASEDSDEAGDLIGLVPPDVSAEESDEIRYDPDTEGEIDDAPDLRQQDADEARRKQQLAEAQARRRAKLAEAAGREIKPRVREAHRKAKEPTTIHVSTRSGTEKAVYDRVMFMVEKAEDEDQLRMIERHISKVFPELARLATEAGLTGKE